MCVDGVDALREAHRVESLSEVIKHRRKNKIAVVVIMCFFPDAVCVLFVYVFCSVIYEILYIFNKCGKNNFHFYFALN